MSPSEFSYTTWLLHDKHADAFGVLTRDVGQKIARYMQISEWDPVEQVGLALAALDAAHRDLLQAANRKPTAREARRSETIRELVTRPAFPPRYDSPRRFRGGSCFDPRLTELFGHLAR